MKLAFFIPGVIVILATLIFIYSYTAEERDEIEATNNLCDTGFGEFAQDTFVDAEERCNEAKFKSAIFSMQFVLYSVGLALVLIGLMPRKKGIIETLKGFYK